MAAVQRLEVLGKDVGTRVGVVAASSDVIRLLPAKTSVSCAVHCKAAQSRRKITGAAVSLTPSTPSVRAPIAETSPCKVDAAFSGAFQGDSFTATTPVAFEVRRWKESHHRLPHMRDRVWN